MLRQIRRFRLHTGGNVGMLFAFALIPAIGLFGLAGDFAIGLVAKRRLDAAADAAVLRTVSKSSNPSLDQPTQDAARATFNAQLGQASNITIKDTVLTSGYVNGNLQVSLRYQASVPTNFGSIFHVPSLALSGSATAVAPIPAYANFYLLLDNSPSMGFGATTNDISRLQSLTGGCAFACHEHMFQSGRITGDKISDNYHVAKNNGITTRIDVERTAAQHLFDAASKNQTYQNQYKAGIYTFSDVFEAIAPLSSDLQTVSMQAQKIDLAYSYFNGRDAQTSYDTAFSYMSSLIADGGDGMSSSTPMAYLFVVTDGVEDQPTGQDGSGANDKPDGWVAPSKETSPPASASPNLANTLTGNFKGNTKRMIATFSSGSTLALNKCRSMKDRGVKIAILYTAYLPVRDGTYSTYVAPIINQVPNDLQNCASPNLFFTVTPTQGIDDAMKIMFKAATSGLPRLTQ